MDWKNNSFRQPVLGGIKNVETNKAVVFWQQPYFSCLMTQQSIVDAQQPSHIQFCTWFERQCLSVLLLTVRLDDSFLLSFINQPTAEEQNGCCKINAYQGSKPGAHDVHPPISPHNVDYHAHIILSLSAFVKQFSVFCCFADIFVKSAKNYDFTRNGYEIP